jgi:hypothetical protein
VSFGSGNDRHRGEAYLSCGGRNRGADAQINRGCPARRSSHAAQVLRAHHHGHAAAGLQRDLRHRWVAGRELAVWRWACPAPSPAHWGRSFGVFPLGAPPIGRSWGALHPRTLGAALLFLHCADPRATRPSPQLQALPTSGCPTPTAPCRAASTSATTAPRARPTRCARKGGGWGVRVRNGLGLAIWAPPPNGER